MPVQPSPTQCYAKALIFALLASSATAGPMHEGGMHSSPASNGPVTITRSLRSSMFVKTSDDANEHERRILMPLPNLSDKMAALTLTSEAEMIQEHSNKRLTDMGLSSSLEEPMSALALKSKEEMIQEHSNKRFTELGLDNIEADRLSTNADRLEQWFHDVNAHLQAKHLATSEKELSDAIFKTLSGHYEGHDLAVALLAATSSPSKLVRDTATHLKKAQFQVWEKLKTAGVFTLLKLDKIKDDKLFENPLFLLWVDFARAENPKPKEAAYTAMFETFSTHYNDAALVDFFAGAMKRNSLTTETSPIAFALEGFLLRKWEALRIEIATVFETVKADKEKYGVFESTRMQMWEKFVKRSLPKSKVYKAMFKILKAKYNDYGLANAIFDEKDSQRSRIIVRNLRSNQFSEWKAAEMSSDAVFKLLMRSKTDADVDAETRSNLIKHDYEEFCGQNKNGKRKGDVATDEDSPPQNKRGFFVRLG